MSARVVVALVVVVVAAACDPLPFLAQWSGATFAREALITECCTCLVDTRVDVEDRDERCADALDDESQRCVCTVDDVDECAFRLREGETVTVLGACVDLDGPCREACDDTLVFPPE